MALLPQRLNLTPSTHPSLASSPPPVVSAQTWSQFQANFAGALHIDPLTRQLFATDASVYQELPAAVAYPAHAEDIRLLISFAQQTRQSLIPRTAGTSLAGQVVGAGIVVDVSRNFTEILEINREEQWVRLQPGVIRNELNAALAPHGLFFGPETSTANRAMLGGMLGNNSCGANSIVYGATRDQVLSVSGYLSDGSFATFQATSPEALQATLNTPSPTFYETIVQGMVALLMKEEHQRWIREQYPKPSVSRRNTGYALDSLLLQQPFSQEGPPFNLSSLIAGSEGTLFFATEIVLRCHPLPSPHRVLIASHFAQLADSLYATPRVMKQSVTACELIDHYILEGAARNREQLENMQFVIGEPAAILLTEVRGTSDADALQQANQIVSDLKEAGLGYAHPTFINDEAFPIWELRKAGLGIAASVVGDEKPVTVIEDTAVAVEDFPAYTLELGKLLLDKYGISCVHYGHAGAGELHLRPLINLKSETGLQQFREVGTDVAALVRKYRGSLSGEHGDGRLRGEFLQFMMGAENYQLLRQVKQLWDPNNLFNPGKIVDAPPMDRWLRTSVESAASPEIETLFDFSGTQGVLRAAEMCSGSGDCRKTPLGGGTMCPSYMATRDEKDSTRARANMMRHVLTGTSDRRDLGSPMLKEVMDLCLSCKGCKRECPSNVDVAKLKAEFTQAYYDVHGVPWRARLIASLDRIHRIAAWVPWLHNFLIRNPITSGLAKRWVGFDTRRQIPQLCSPNLRSWFHQRQRNHHAAPVAGSDGKSVFLFCDEFTNYLDTPVGIAAIELLEKLGYTVKMIDHRESGRAALSKGLLRQARDLAEFNVQTLAPLVSDETPLLGIEPSAILSLIDEYPELVRPEFRERAKRLASHTQLIDTFLANEFSAGRIQAKQFTNEPLSIRLHGHCHQKALGTMVETIRILQIPSQYRVKIIPSGCCGMAGAFGYEQEHYDLSMRIGELVLFPAIRKEGLDTVIAAPGTSCRHQIFDGTGRTALHPVQILRAALAAGR